MGTLRSRILLLFFFIAVIPAAILGYILIDMLHPIDSTGLVDEGLLGFINSNVNAYGLMFAAGVLIAVMFLATWFADRTTASINSLARSCADIKKGHYDTPVPEINTHDELADIRNAIVSLKQEVVHLRHDIGHKSHAIVDKQLKDEQDKLVKDIESQINMIRHETNTDFMRDI